MMEIQGNKVEGYLWYSDRDKPVVYDGVDLTLDLNDEDNPFIIEGQLYDRNSEKSYCIKYIDGKYIVCQYFNVKRLEENPKKNEEKEYEITDKFYQSNHMGGRILHFKEVWRAVCDKLCCNMEIFQPAEVIFVGFKIEENNYDTRTV